MHTVVTTCVVVWIEILTWSGICCIHSVTTCVVVWIEILVPMNPSSTAIGHHLRGGVD